MTQQQPSLGRQLGSVAALPLMAAVVVPGIILYLGGWPLEAGPWAWVLRLAGVIVVTVGLALGVGTMILFARQGQGTLAPWDPPQRLVKAGPYCYLRNPMISGAMLILLGEALLWLDLALLAWFALFALANALYIPLWEEPGLERRFGDSYRLYKAQVPRWLPRPRPWQPTRPGDEPPQDPE